MKISKEKARLYLLNYQNLLPPKQMKEPDDIIKFINKTGCIQYDPLNIAGRNADLVLQSRYKNYKESILLC